MEKEIKGHIDILSFNIDKVLKELKGQTTHLTKMDLDIHKELKLVKASLLKA